MLHGKLFPRISNPQNLLVRLGIRCLSPPSLVISFRDVFPYNEYTSYLSSMPFPPDRMSELAQINCCKECLDARLFIVEVDGAFCLRPLR